MYKISELYDLDHTLAKDYLAQFEYPWQALAGIKEFILEVRFSSQGNNFLLSA